VVGTLRIFAGVRELVDLRILLGIGLLGGPAIEFDRLIDNFYFFSFFHCLLNKNLL